MPKENRNPPKPLAGPQGTVTLLAESNERFAMLETKLDTLIELVSKVLTLVQPAEELVEPKSAMKADAKAKKYGLLCA